MATDSQKAVGIAGLIGTLASLGVTLWPRKASAADVPVPTPQTTAAAQSGGQQCQQAFQTWKAAAEGANGAWVVVAGLEPSKDLPGTDAAYAQAVERAIQATNFSAGKMVEYEACMRSLGLDPHRPSGATR